MNPVIPRSSVFHVISREPTLSIIVPFPRGEGYGGFNELERIVSMQFFYNFCTKSALETNHDIVISALQLIHRSINKYVTSRFQLKLKISLNFL